jgi:hypothetical protein
LDYIGSGWQTVVKTVFFFFFLVSLGGVRLSPLGKSATVGLLCHPRMIEDDYGAVGGMRIGRGNRPIDSINAVNIFTR